jgi:hypothetical protein
VNIRERASEIKGIFYTNCKDIILEPPYIKKTEGQKYMGDGTIYAEIKFIDDYLLNFIEEITGGNITRYMYEYICLKTHLRQIQTKTLSLNHPVFKNLFLIT